MNKSFNLAKKQQRFNDTHSYSRHKREQAFGEQPYFSTANGFRLFSYKGVVVEKINAVYRVNRRIVISGFPVVSLDGDWSDGAAFKNAIDYSLLSVKDESRHAEVREQYKNWECPTCHSIHLADPKLISPIYKYRTDEWNQEHRIDTGKRAITCIYCHEDCPVDEIQYASDTIFL